MKMVEAIIRKEKFPAVDAALKRIGVGGLTMAEATGRGRTRETTTVHARGNWTLEGEYLPRLKIEIIVKDSEAQAVVDSIVKNASTGSVGDGKVLVSAISEVLDIGSKAVDEKAIAPAPRA